MQIKAKKRIIKTVVPIDAKQVHARIKRVLKIYFLKVFQSIQLMHANARSTTHETFGFGTFSCN